MSSFIYRRIRIKTAPLPGLVWVFLIAALLVSGCSGSSSNSGEESQPLDEVVIESEDESDGGLAEESTSVTAEQTSSETTEDDAESTSTVEQNLSTPDPMVALSTRVTFDITVPAYASDALQVLVAWGDREITAAWVTDESWIVVDDLPTETENSLVVTFSDQNGAIILARFEQSYRTGADASEVFMIGADQFDTEQWDIDGDGVSNIDELIAGSDPVVSNTATDTNSASAETLLPVSASIELIADKTFRIRWQPANAADFYRVLENPDGISGFTDISGELDASTEFYDHRVGLHQRVNARYMVEACDSRGCTLSAQQLIEGNLAEAIGYFKASNPDQSDLFGSVVSISGDGNTLAVSAPFEDGAATVVNGDQGDNSAEGSGAVYVFIRNGSGWQQQAYLKASNTESRDIFGMGLSLSADGNTLAVGAAEEDSNARGINGDQDDNSSSASGAVYVFARNGDSWQQQAYVKAGSLEAENDSTSDEFGTTVSLSVDGDTLAVGARREGVQGAVYVFVRSSGVWQQQAVLNPSRSDDGIFGRAVSLSADGNVLAASARVADFRGVFNTSVIYIFVRANGDWQEDALIEDLIATSRISLSGNGKTLAVADGSDAAIFDNIDGSWQEQARFVQFGRNSTLDFETDGISLSADGNTVAIGNSSETTGQIGLQGFQGIQPQFEGAGAVNVFTRGDGTWQQQVYVKASNTSTFDAFGVGVSLSANGDSLAVGARGEGGAGAIYLY